MTKEDWIDLFSEIGKVLWVMLIIGFYLGATIGIVHLYTWLILGERFVWVILLTIAIILLTAVIVGYHRWNSKRN